MQAEANRTDWNSSFDVALFDSTLGSLTAVSVTLWGEVGSIFEIASHNQGARTATLNSEALIETGLGGVSITPFGNFTTPVIESGSSYTSDLVTGEDSITVTFSDLAELDEWIGDGSRSIGVSGWGDSFVSGAGNVGSSIDTWVRASLTIAYTYEEPTQPVVDVPAPASLALVGVGLLGLAATRRRKV